MYFNVVSWFPGTISVKPYFNTQWGRGALSNWVCKICPLIELGLYLSAQKLRGEHCPPGPLAPTVLYSIHNIACSFDYSAACLTYRKWDSRHGRVGQRPEKHHLGRRDGEGGVEGAKGKGGEWTWAMPQGDCYLSLVHTWIIYYFGLFFRKCSGIQSNQHENNIWIQLLLLLFSS